MADNDPSETNDASLWSPGGTIYEEGPKGDKGDPGPAPVITVDPNVGVGNASVTITGDEGEYELHFIVPEGKEGPQGPPRPAPSFNVEVNQLDQGEQPTGEVEGEDPNYTIILGIPPGPKGDTGDSGDSTVIYSGADDPNNEVGEEGDYYLNTSNYRFYGPKALNGDGEPDWSVTPYIVLKGEKGDKGDKGEDGKDGIVEEIVAGEGISVDSTDPSKPIVSATGGSGGGIPEAPDDGKLYGRKNKAWAEVTGGGGSGTVESIVAGNNIDVDSTDPANPIVSATVEKGDKGDTGDAATISVGTVTTGAAGSNALVVNSGTSSAAKFDFTIPRGDKGEPGNAGTAATISVGTVTTGSPGSQATVNNTGSSSAAIFDFRIPEGAKGDKGEQGEQGPKGDGISIKGTLNDSSELPTPPADPSDAYIIDGDLYVWDGSQWNNVGPIQGPKGEQGDAATIAVGNVTSGESASITNSGTSAAAVFDFVLPKGDKGDKGDQGEPGAPGVVQSIVAGNNVSVDNTDPANPVVSSSGQGEEGSRFIDIEGEDFRFSDAKLGDQYSFSRNGESSYIEGGVLNFVGVDEPVFEDSGWRLRPAETNLLWAWKGTEMVSERTNISTIIDGDAVLFERTRDDKNCHAKNSRIGDFANKRVTATLEIEVRPYSDNTGFRLQATYPARVDVIFRADTRTASVITNSIPSSNPEITIEPLADDTYRVSLTATVTQPSGNTSFYFGPTKKTTESQWEDDSAISRCYIKSAQFNEGGVIPPIPTTDAAVTRPADVATINQHSTSTSGTILISSIYPSTDGLYLSFFDQSNTALEVSLSNSKLTLSSISDSVSADVVSTVWAITYTATEAWLFSNGVKYGPISHDFEGYYTADFNTGEIDINHRYHYIRFAERVLEDEDLLYATTEGSNPVFPDTSPLLVRNNLSDVADSEKARENIGAIGEAPSDGKLYGRKNSEWEEVTSGGGSGFANMFAGVSRAESVPSDSTDTSASAYACKGQIFDVVEDVQLSTVLIPVKDDRSHNGFLGVLNKNDDTLKEVLFNEAVPNTNSTSSSYTSYGLILDLSSVRMLNAGERICICAIITESGTSPTTAVKVRFPSSIGYDIPGLDYYGCVRYATQDPQINDAMLLDKLSSVYMQLTYFLPNKPNPVYPPVLGQAGKVLTVASDEKTLEWQTVPVSVGITTTGTPDAGATLATYLSDSAWQLTGAIGYAGTAPDGGAVSLDLQVNGVSAGTINFSNGQNVGNFTGAGGTVGSGDRVSIVAPADLYDIADVSITISGK